MLKNKLVIWSHYPEAALNYLFQLNNLHFLRGKKSEEIVIDRSRKKFILELFVFVLKYFSHSIFVTLLIPKNTFTHI